MCEYQRVMAAAIAAHSARHLDERAVDTCSKFFFAILDMTAAIRVCPCHQSGTLGLRVGLDWLGAMRWRRKHFLNPGMLAVLRVKWLPTLHSFRHSLGINVPLQQMRSDFKSQVFLWLSWVLPDITEKS
eukprot:1159581-Pelagomonas_calceolata.AAC.1